MKKLFIYFLISFFLLTYVKEVNAQMGRVGINTTTPSAMLHVKDSSVVFTGAIPGFPLTPGNPPVSGAGVRMMWYPDKIAFRVGQVYQDEWDKQNVGYYSFAAGSGAKAFGDFSTAIGDNNYALGAYSLALGSSCWAYNSNSIAMGDNTFATGYGALALNYQTEASGGFSTAMGEQTTARAFASLTIGRYNDSIATSSTFSWVPTDPVFMIGNGSAYNARSNAFVVLKNAKTGINSSNPQSMLHVKESSVPGAIYNPNSVAIFEGSGNGAFIQLSQPSNVQSGILSGNAATDTRSGIVFRPDSSIQLRTGGNTARFVVDKTGRTGINVGGTTAAALEIKGVDATDNRHLRLEDFGSTDAANIFYDGDLVFKNNKVGNGFKFRNSVNSTVFQVSASGTLTIAGGGAAAGKVLTSSDASGNASWQDIVVPKFGFNATINATQSINPSVITTVLFDNQQFNDGGGFNAGTGQYTAPSAGLYHFELSVYWSAMTAREILYLVKNGVRIKYNAADVASGNFHSQKLNVSVKLVAGDVISVQVLHTNAAARSVNNQDESTYFTGYKVY